MSVLKLELKPGESVTIGNGVTLTLEEKEGQAARLSFEADRSIPIERVGDEPARPGGNVAAESGIRGVARRT